jgi:2-(1,2-epoxy-1,2-dihydrophenyl)acetyl-CoA isomerase
MEIMAFDEPISAPQAAQWGLVMKVVPDEDVLSESVAILSHLTGRSLHSFAWSKRLMTHSFEHTLETQLELERQGISACGAHPDGREGIRAFVEKRKPTF